MEAVLYIGFLLLVGALIGGAAVVYLLRAKLLNSRKTYDKATADLLDLQKELRDITIEQITACSDNVRVLYEQRQDDVTRYVKGSDASLQLVNELMGHVNSAIGRIDRTSQSARAHIDHARKVADEMRRLLNEIKFADLAAVLASMDERETYLLDMHKRIETQQEIMNERSA